MKAMFWATGFLFLSAVPSSCERTATSEQKVLVVERLSGPEEEVAAITKRGEQLLEAVRSEDLETLIEGFTDDVVLIPQGQPVVKGKDALRVFYRTQFKEFDIEDLGGSLEEVQVVGDWAFTRGTAAVVGCVSGHDDSFRVFNRGLEIWHREEGVWKIARAIGNR